MYTKFFTSESVGAGHPDKICDQIADLILDKILKQDPEAHVACEVMASNRLIVIGGEITTKGYVDVVSTAWEILKTLDYSESDFTVISSVHNQSSDINQGINKQNGAIGAGDQGMMFGYAINETKELMPLAITLAHELAKRAETLRLNKKFLWAKADLKSQVTIDYQNSEPQIATILMSVQHEANYKERKFKNFIKKEIMDYVARQYNLNTDYQVLINPTGKFVIGGPIGDTGLTGRKIIVDTYGGKAHHGGGSFSGKDGTKVDRSGAYAARWVAKNIVGAQLADECEIQLSYAIGIDKPLAITIETFGTEKVAKAKIENAVAAIFDLTPKGIITALDLKKPIYAQTATFGHFGNPDFAWEKLNKVAALKKYLKDSD